ncbi:MAG: TlyA family RNA methyltransferase [Thermoleophilia bacterium]|nr:TlyA family RNA methyltransferase [Thermoleophilia bacterium]
MTPPRHPVRKSRHRLDTILVQRGYFDNRSRAAAAVLAGLVLVDGNVEHKAGRQVPPDVNVEVVEDPVYVSRGGYKLERAFDAFDLNWAGRVALDAGASTGGFTDCLLQNGVSRVIAIDVGYGQLDWRLRQDPRVQVLERTNIRYLECEDLSELPEVASLDLSFISLKKALPAVIKCLRHGFEMVALVKPQFEAGREKVGKGGVVRDPRVHRQVLLSLWDHFSDMEITIRGLVESPVRGPKGNIEYLMYMIDGRSAVAQAEARSVPGVDKEQVVDEVISRAMEALGGRLVS